MQHDLHQQETDFFYLSKLSTIYILTNRTIIYIYIYIYIIHTCIHTHTHVYVHLHIYTYTHTYTHIGITLDNTKNSSFLFLHKQ